jgi:hypothetical protein
VPLSSDETKSEFSFAESKNYLQNSVMCYVTRHGLGLVIGFNELLKLITTHNNSVATNSYTLQFTTACTESSQFAVSSLGIAREQLPVL